MPDLIIGRNPVIEALRADHPIEKIFILHGTHGKSIQQIKSIARERGIVWSEVSKQKFKELSIPDSAQGVAALAAIKEYEDFDTLLVRLKKLPSDEKPFLLLLDEITDPHNLGALIRTAECTGVNGVILPKHHSALITDAVVKASSGAVEYVPVSRVTNIAQTIDTLKDNGFWIVGTDSTAENRFDEIDYTSPIAIVIGSEGKGIRRLVKEKCDHVVKIPLKGKIKSLNASVAGALMMYEVMRQREKI